VLHFFRVVPTNPYLLIFAAGVLVGADIVLLGRLVPDVIAIIKSHAAHRRQASAKGRIFFS